MLAVEGVKSGFEINRQKLFRNGIKPTTDQPPRVRIVVTSTGDVRGDNRP